MTWTNADQMAYNARRRKAGDIVRVTVDLTPTTAYDWQAYADAIGRPRATMLRECVRRCMIADGWTGAHEPAPSQPAPDEPAPPAPVLVEPVKRKPGRPRKVQPEPDAPDAQQQPKRGRGRPRKTAPTE